MFSKTCEYGLRAVVYIAEESVSGNKVGLKTISNAINSPEAFTGKILQLLSKNHIIKSIKGPYGGFLIEEKKLSKIKLSAIVDILDGDKVYKGCALGLHQCDENYPCPLHHKFVKIREDLRLLLEQNTLHDLLYTNNIKNKFWLDR